jgi:biotin carboxylase
VHLAVVDCNPASLQGLRMAVEAGHRVSYLQPAQPLYELAGENLRIVRSVDWLVESLDTTDACAVTAALAARHARQPIDAVVTFQELAAEAVATACRSLGVRGTPLGAVFTARRKDACRAALTRAGVASARYALARDVAGALAAAERIGYPVMLKPPSGSASLLARVARTEAEAAAAVAAILAGPGAVPDHWRAQFRRGVLVEELLVGELVSVEIGVRDGEFFPFCVTGRFRWHGDEVVELGSCLPAGLPAGQRDQCVTYARQVCAAIGASLGVFHLEIMVTARGPVLVEFNPRIMGGGLPSAYRHATGQDIYRSLLQLLAGSSVDVPASFSGSTGVFAAMPLGPGRLPAAASLHPLAARPDVLEVIGFDSYRTGPGQPVAAGQAVARFVLRAASRADVMARGSHLLGQLAGSLGVPLMTGFHPGA